MNPKSNTTRHVELLLDRQHLEVIPFEECEQLLHDGDLGRVGFLDRGEITILPVNYTFCAGSILFRTAPGSKLDIASMQRPASFEIDHWDPETRTGWSILVKGTSDFVTDPWLTSMYDSLGVEPWADHIPRDNWIRIRADEISGRRIVKDDALPTASEMS